LACRSALALLGEFVLSIPALSAVAGYAGGYLAAG
jgi:hypothetical protein